MLFSKPEIRFSRRRAEDETRRRARVGDFSRGGRVALRSLLSKILALWTRITMQDALDVYRRGLRIAQTALFR
jgi:hypothetical protein